jgi:hypothetical protein
MFLVCAISDILQTKLTFVDTGSAEYSEYMFYNKDVISPIFRKYSQEKFKLYRAFNALNTARIRISGIRDELISIKTLLINEISTGVDRKLYTKRSINNKIKTWYESVQNYSGGNRLMLEKYNIDEGFKNKALEMFMKQSKHMMDSEETRERTKKILSIGLPSGLIDELERRNMYSSETSPYIKIRVHKRHFLDDSITYTPRDFYFKLEKDVVYNNFKTYVQLSHGLHPTLEGGYSALPTSANVEHCTSYNEFMKKNTSVLNLDSSTYETMPWMVTIDSLETAESDDTHFVWAKRSLNSKLYQYYIQSLYGVEISPESLLEEKELLSVKDYVRYTNNLDKPELFLGVLKQKSVMFNSSKTYYETTKKQLFDKIFHVLIDTEEDFINTDSDAEALNNLEVKYDDYYVTIDIINGSVEEESNTSVFDSDSTDIETPDDPPPDEPFDPPITVQVFENDILRYLEPLEWDNDDWLLDRDLEGNLRDSLEFDFLDVQKDLERLLGKIFIDPADWIRDYFLNSSHGSTFPPVTEDFIRNFDMNYVLRNNLIDMLQSASAHGINASELIKSFELLVSAYRNNIINNVQNNYNNAAAAGNENVMKSLEIDASQSVMDKAQNNYNNAAAAGNVNEMKSLEIDSTKTEYTQTKYYGK